MNWRWRRFCQEPCLCIRISWNVRSKSRPTSLFAKNQRRVVCVCVCIYVHNSSGVKIESFCYSEVVKQTECYSEWWNFDLFQFSCLPCRRRQNSDHSEKFWFPLKRQKKNPGGWGQQEDPNKRGTRSNYIYSLWIHKPGWKYSNW